MAVKKTSLQLLKKLESNVAMDLLYKQTDFLPKEIAKIRPKTRFNTKKKWVAQIPCVV